MPSEAPRVGVGVFVLNEDNQFVMGVRKGSIGAGTIALPGGHLDFGESFEECARREVKEETGQDVESVRFLTAINSVLEREGKHYVTIFMVAKLRDGKQKPTLLEPDKCEGWFWVEWETMRRCAVDELEGHKTEESTPFNNHPKGILFLPLLNLVRDQPDVLPHLLPTRV